MRPHSNLSIIRRSLASKVKKLVGRGPLLAATFAEVYRVCGKRSCRCYQGQKHRACQLTYSQGGKTRVVYVPVDLTEEVRSWIEEHQRLQQLIEEISQLSLILVRSHVQERRRKRGRA